MRTAIQVTQHVKYILFNLYLTFVFDTLGGGGDSQAVYGSQQDLI